MNIVSNSLSPIFFQNARPPEYPIHFTHKHKDTIFAAYSQSELISLEHEDGTDVLSRGNGSGNSIYNI